MIIDHLFTGTETATKCPVGTYRSQTGGVALSDCVSCTAGSYCQTQGLTAATGPCAERYYCPDVAQISDSQPSAYICPTGYYCPAGTADPIGCPPGKLFI